MFSDESFYTAKVFLKSVADAQSALKYYNKIKYYYYFYKCLKITLLHIKIIINEYFLFNNREAAEYNANLK